MRMPLLRVPRVGGGGDPTSSERLHVKISDIIPYERNARHNKKAIPAVADSIREFGLRGQIVLESRQNPVIVTGHIRVASASWICQSAAVISKTKASRMAQSD